MNHRLNLVVMREYLAIGVPVWRLAAARREAVWVYAPLRLAKVADSFEDKSDLLYSKYEDKYRAWADAFSRELETIDFLWEDAMALYTPRTEREFHLLCSATSQRGGTIQVIAPRDLSVSDLTRLSLAWKQASRRIRYLVEHDLCSELNLPWLYLLTLYNFDPLRTAFIAKSKDVVDQFRAFLSDVPDVFEYSIDEITLADEKDWNKIYRALESQAPEKYWHPTERPDP